MSVDLSLKGASETETYIFVITVSCGLWWFGRNFCYFISNLLSLLADWIQFSTEVILDLPVAFLKNNWKIFYVYVVAFLSIMLLYNNIHLKSQIIQIFEGMCIHILCIKSTHLQWWLADNDILIQMYRQTNRQSFPL